MTEITAPLSLTAPGSFYGLPVADGARLAVEEANQASPAGRIELRLVDDHSGVDAARDLAGDICKTSAVVTIGPALTIAALTAGPVYAECGLVAIPPTAHGDSVPRAATFQPVFNGGAMGSALAAYLRHVLGGHRAIVMFRKDGYGTPFADGFQQAAAQLGMPVAVYGFTGVAERDAAVRAVADDPEHVPIALGMLNDDAVPILVALRRQGYRTPVLGPSAIGGEDFVSQFAKEPEEAQQKGFFTEQLYAASPMLFDSANAETLGFAERFRQRYGRAPS